MAVREIAIPWDAGCGGCAQRGVGRFRFLRRRPPYTRGGGRLCAAGEAALSEVDGASRKLAVRAARVRFIRFYAVGAASDARTQDGYGLFSRCGLHAGGRRASATTGLAAPAITIVEASAVSRTTAGDPAYESDVRPAAGGTRRGGAAGCHERTGRARGGPCRRLRGRRHDRQGRRRSIHYRRCPGRWWEYRWA